MIRFFRKTRIKLLIENKLAKYFIYAIGEVLIVIAGILIAIQINNWNQQRLAEIKINRLLLEIQNKLEDEIEYAREGIEYYNYKDTLLRRVKEGKVKREEFNTEISWSSPQYALSGYANGYSLNKNAYNNIVQISDQIPAKYDSLFMNLTLLYIDINDDVKERESKLLEKYYKYETFTIENHEFRSEAWQKKPLDDKVIDYYLHDPIYMNWVYEIHDDFMKHQKSLKEFVKHATEIRNQILELELDKEKK